MAKLVKFPLVHSGGAGIDIGSREIFVSIDGTSVQKFPTFTQDYHLCCRYLVDHGITCVAMEATGVYWMCLYSMLEDYGIYVCLVNPREIQQVKGRKSDVRDCQWIRHLFVSGLLRESLIPQGLLKELRIMVRERGDLIEMGSTYVNKMHRCLELMNIKLGEVISQIHGASGLSIIRAIIGGERDLDTLLSLCHNQIQQRKGTEVKKALEGNYNEYYLHLLDLNLNMWEYHQKMIKEIEHKIAELLDKLNESTHDIEVQTKSKPSRHHQPDIESLHQKMVQLYGGVDLTSISGINDVTLLRLYGEVGSDMSRFPGVKHFVSWLGLSPAHKQSGKMKRRIKANPGNHAGQIFRQSAQSLKQSKYNAIGVFIRRISAKKGSQIGIKAGARKIAQAYYMAITKGMDYVEQGAEKYMEQQKQRDINLLNKLAQKFNYELMGKGQ